jgi:hypothetical protein
MRLITVALPHAVGNAGSVNLAELETYVVEKGKPIFTLAE